MITINFFPSISTVTYLYCLFENNEAITNGGAINIQTTLQKNIIQYCIFKHNSGKQGAVINIGILSGAYFIPIVYILDSIFIQNIGMHSIIAMEDEATVTITNSQFIQNTIKGGDGIISVQGVAKLTISDTTSKQNIVQRNGGAIYRK
jgi:predicted outer membrane repeat protein